MQPKALSVKSLYETFAQTGKLPEEAFVQGWVRTNRDSGSIGFISLNDGTCFKCLQIVYSDGLECHEQIKSVLTGACIRVGGKIVATPNMKQPFELHAESFELLGIAKATIRCKRKGILLNTFGKSPTFALGPTPFWPFTGSVRVWPWGFMSSSKAKASSTSIPRR